MSIQDEKAAGQDYLKITTLAAIILFLGLFITGLAFALSISPVRLFWW